MKAFFTRKEKKNVVPVTRENFRRYTIQMVLLQAAACGVFLGLHYFEVINTVILCVLLFVVPLLINVKQGKMIEGRFRMIFPDSRTSSTDLALYAWIPPLYLVLAAYGSFVETSQSRLIPRLGEKKFLIPVYLLAWLIAVPTACLPRSKYFHFSSLLPASVSYITNVGGEALTVFEQKQKLGAGDLDSMAEALSQQLENPGITGKILGTAMVSTEAVYRGKDADTPEKRRLFLKMLEDHLVWEESGRTAENVFFLGFHPMHFLNPVSVFEVAMITYIEHDEETKRKSMMGRKLRTLISLAEKNLGREPAHESRLTNLRAKVDALFPLK